MPKLAIVATIEAVAGRMDELLPLLMAHRARCLKDEPGTLQFDFLIPSDDKTKVLLIEVYSDEDSFKAHWNGVNRRSNLTPDRRPILTPLSGGFWR